MSVCVLCLSVYVWIVYSIMFLCMHMCGVYVYVCVCMFVSVCCGCESTV